MSNSKTQIWSAWSGLAAMTFFFVGMIVAGMLPPPGPYLTADQVVALYRDNAVSIRIGMAIVMISGMLVIPLVGLISLQLKRIEGISPLLTYTQLSAGSLNVMFFLLPGLCFLITAYRPERSPEITYIMNDVCWISLVMVWMPGFMQNMAIGFGILADKNVDPIFPRWVAFLNFWVAILFVPAILLAFVRSGPFAWNGLFAFWIPATAFGVWFIVMPWACIRATRRQAANAVSSSAATLEPANS